MLSTVDNQPVAITHMREICVSTTGTSAAQAAFLTLTSLFSVHPPNFSSYPPPSTFWTFSDSSRAARLEVDHHQLLESLSTYILSDILSICNRRNIPSTHTCTSVCSSLLYVPLRFDPHTHPRRNRYPDELDALMNGRNGSSCW